MIDDNGEGMCDPLRAAFTDHRRAPRDVVPHVKHSLDVLRHLADGTAQVTVTHYQLGEHGVTRHVERATITAPIINTRREEHL